MPSTPEGDAKRRAFIAEHTGPLKTAGYRSSEERGGWWRNFVEPARTEVCSACGKHTWLVGGIEDSYCTNCGVREASPFREYVPMAQWARIGVVADKFPADWPARYECCRAGGMPDEEPNHWLRPIFEKWQHLRPDPLTNENLAAYLNLERDLTPDQVRAMSLAALNQVLKEDLDARDAPRQQPAESPPLSATENRPNDLEPPTRQVFRDQKTEARDKWIYEQCCKGIAYDTIALRLPKKNKRWAPIVSKQGIQQAARKYAERHQLPPPPPRQGL